MILAARSGQSDAVVELLISGANPEARTFVKGQTALWHAACNGHDQTVFQLILRGAEIDALDHDGASALFAAVDMGHEAIVRQLIRSGASIDLARNDGFTPLMIAVAQGHISIAEILLKKGI